MEQNIDYEWLPAKCKKCSNYAHTIAECRRGEIKKVGEEVKGKVENKEKKPAATTYQEKRLIENKQQQQGKEWVIPKKTTPMKVLKTLEKATAETKTQGEECNSFNVLQDLEVGLAENQSKSKAEVSGVGALLETKLRGNKIQEFIDRKFVQWDQYSSPTIEGCILIVWRRSFVRVIVIEENPQYTHCFIKMVGQEHACCITIVYVGDFNALFELEDREGGNVVELSGIQDASNWLAQSNLEPMLKSGSNFTWTNNQEGIKRIYSKIDHIFINEYWFDRFPNSAAHFNWETISDHCACVVSIKVNKAIGAKPFRYFNFWSFHPDFINVVKENWNKPLRCTRMKVVFFKLVRLKHCFKQFNNHVIGYIGKEYEAAKNVYTEAKLNSQAEPSSHILQQQEKEAAERYSLAENMYHSFLSQ
ncbi:uncharacterized protein LOC133030528 [Cannabis sativa]|uniref:uncharacterized protein LOC133030528 n=1 Tax=Cannabis sativa TaxID=3483 RepID=UPI0029CA82F5|nr:uncharacterized protein LOC133030528 [Cannabis sativa]